MFQRLGAAIRSHRELEDPLVHLPAGLLAGDVCVGCLHASCLKHSQLKVFLH